MLANHRTSKFGKNPEGMRGGGEVRGGMLTGREQGRGV